jgi:hypothetical protein
VFKHLLVLQVVAKFNDNTTKPPITLITPKGNGWAHFLIDYGIEHDLIWVVFQDDTGECWSWLNRDIKIQSNITLNRKKV